VEKKDWHQEWVSAARVVGKCQVVEVASAQLRKCCNTARPEQEFFFSHALNLPAGETAPRLLVDDGESSDDDDLVPLSMRQRPAPAAANGGAASPEIANAGANGSLEQQLLMLSMQENQANSTCSALPQSAAGNGTLPGFEPTNNQYPLS